jgi:uncharacterized membrane protein YvbJ
VVQDLVKGSLTDDQKVIQEKARLLFQEYLKTNPSLDKLTLKTLTDSTNSEIIKNLSNKFEAHFNEKFKEYKFLDNQTKEFLKI